jgi:predicted extracellular nuclease
VERHEVRSDVVAVGPGPRLLATPSRLEHPAFEGDPEGESSGARRPLLAELEVDGETVFVVVVHLTSKGGDDRPFGPQQPPCPRSQAQRTRQATAIAAVVERLLGADPDARVIVLGDFNEFQERPPIRALERAGLVNLTWLLLPPERYTYVFQGVSQALDHVLVSRALAEGAEGAEVDVVHVNAEFPARERTSDHDPVVVSLPLGGVDREPGRQAEAPQRHEDRE